jgi:hypothetical protein
MEKQMALFETEENNDLTIWPELPEENREKIETIFAQILINHLRLSLKEVKNHEK